MRYGHFDVKNREYVITRPDTPLPWINYLGTGDYCAMISNTAGGYSFYKDASQRRLTRYRYNNIPLDSNGRYLYVRDDESGKFWSSTWQPIRHDLAKYKYECRHGMSYTVISSEHQGIATRNTYFVPEGESLEVWRMELSNTGKKPRKLTVASFVEWCLWDALNDMTDFQYNLNIASASFDKKTGTIIHQTGYRARKQGYAFFSASGKVASFDTERFEFLGSPYGGLDAPRNVARGRGSSTLACDWAPVGSHFIPISLKPGETKTLIFVLGYGQTLGDQDAAIARYKDPARAQQALDQLKASWEGHLGRFQAKTPDPEVDLMVNTWSQYQVRTTFNWSRSASYYESGIGRGMGFRDSNQDTLGFAYQDPAKVRERLLDLASTQLADGSARHQYSPLTKKGRGSGFSDDHLWLVLAVAGYLRESGDLAFLNAKAPYDGGSSGTIHEHLERALAYTWAHRGPHGLPKILRADWNDCMNLDMGKVAAGRQGECQSESVMVAQMFVLACKEMAAMARRSGKPVLADSHLEQAGAMAKAIEQAAWDGSWYVRAFCEDGSPIGSSSAAKGESIIHLNSQSWSVLSGAAEGDHGRQAMDAVRRLLFTRYGIMLNAPGYERYDERYGAISLFPPGMNENGAIFCHPNPLAMIAETELGRGDQAMEYYKAILPATKNRIADTHRMEPYIYCQMIAGKGSPKFGQAKNGWLTGTAAWNWVAISQHILGVRPELEGLKIDPCIPKRWKGFSVTRQFRGAEYRIQVRNPRKASKGVASITVDGAPIKGQVLPLFKEGVHQVEVLMG